MVTICPMMGTIWPVNLSQSLLHGSKFVSSGENFLLITSASRTRWWPISVRPGDFPFPKTIRESGAKLSLAHVFRRCVHAECACSLLGRNLWA